MCIKLWENILRENQKKIYYKITEIGFEWKYFGNLTKDLYRLTAWWWSGDLQTGRRSFHCASLRLSLAWIWIKIYLTYYFPHEPRSNLLTHFKFISIGHDFDCFWDDFKNNEPKFEHLFCQNNTISLNYVIIFLLPVLRSVTL